MTKLAEQFSPFSLRRAMWGDEDAYDDARRTLEGIALFRDEVIKAVNGTEHVRVPTGSVPAGSSLVVTVTWGVKFKDTSYSVQAIVEDSADFLEARSIKNQAEASVDVLVVNNDGAAVHTGTLHAVGIHD